MYDESKAVGFRLQNLPYFVNVIICNFLDFLIKIKKFNKK